MLDERECGGCGTDGFGNGDAVAEGSAVLRNWMIDDRGTISFRKVLNSCCISSAVTDRSRQSNIIHFCSGDNSFVDTVDEIEAPARSTLVIFLESSGRGVIEGVIGDGAGGTGELSERVDEASPRGRELFFFKKLIILTIAVKSLF